MREGYAENPTITRDRAGGKGGTERVEIGKGAVEIGAMSTVDIFFSPLPFSSRFVFYDVILLRRTRECAAY